MNEGLTISDLKESEELVNANLDGSVTEVLRKKEMYHLRLLNYHQRQLDELRRTIEVLEEMNSVSYKENTVDDWKKKCLSVIGEEMKLCASSEIYASESAKLDPQHKKRDLRNISLALKTLRDEFRLVAYNKKGMKGFLYGTPDMFEGSEPRFEYL